jgi:hypothetical protein
MKKKNNLIAMMKEEKEQEDNVVYVTQEQYDRWIKNMSKNKTGTSWIWDNCGGKKNNQKYKLYRQDWGNGNGLYFIDKGFNGDDIYVFLKIKKN